MTIPLNPYQKEQRVREMLAALFGVPFSKQRLPLATRRADGSEILREFDAVSEDGKIMAEVKSDKHTDKAFVTTRFPRAMLACRYLELCSAEQKVVVFTDKEFYQHFRAAADGLLQGGVEVVWADLDGGVFINT